MINYNFNTDGNYSYCELTYNNLTFTGTAQCHEDDQDMRSERTGCFIAEMRAKIQMLQWIRDYEILPLVKSYRHLHDCMSHSKQYNKKSYEARCLYRQLQNYEKELITIREEIKESREYLKNYIAKKDELYQRIRAGKTN